MKNLISKAKATIFRFWENTWEASAFVEVPTNHQWEAVFDLEEYKALDTKDLFCASAFILSVVYSAAMRFVLIAANLLLTSIIALGVALWKLATFWRKDK